MRLGLRVLKRLPFRRLPHSPRNFRGWLLDKHKEHDTRGCGQGVPMEDRDGVSLFLYGTRSAVQIMFYVFLSPVLGYLALWLRVMKLYLGLCFETVWGM